MTKEGKIKEAYGEHWEDIKNIVTENGWVSFYHDETRIRDIFHDKNDIDVSPNHNNNWRPKSLQGIENNNGWRKIESEEDLPKEDCNVWVLFTNGEMDSQRYLHLYKNFSTHHYIHVTHYKIISKPERPIY